jgi:hypothetical protein
MKKNFFTDTHSHIDDTIWSMLPLQMRFGMLEILRFVTDKIQKIKTIVSLWKYRIQ